MSVGVECSGGTARTTTSFGSVWDSREYGSGGARQEDVAQAVSDETPEGHRARLRLDELEQENDQLKLCIATLVEKLTEKEILNESDLQTMAAFVDDADDEE